MKLTIFKAWVAGLIGIALTLVVPTAAQASDLYPGAAKCDNPHCYLRAVDFHDNIDSVEANIQHNWMSMLDQTARGYEEPVIDRVSCKTFSTHICPWFVTKQIWISDKGHTKWVEVGVRNGYQPPDWKLSDGRPGCGCQAYFQYWEDGPGGSDHVHVIANISPDDTWHKYAIQRTAGNHTFNILIDGRIVGRSTTTGRNTFGESMIGSETSAATTVQPLSYINYS